MRIRQVKPAFWADARVSALSAPARLFYIGLWMIADDAGWLRWDPPQIANELYGYEARAKRERNALAFLDELIKADRIEVYPCGHALIPRLTDHQHLSVVSKQVRTVQREHAECEVSPPLPAETRGNPPVPSRKRKGEGNVNGGGNGTVGKSQGKGSARDLAPSGAVGATDEEDVPDFLRVVQ